MEALAALSKATPAETGTTPVVESLVAATSRKNTAFRKAALAALDAAVTALPGDHFPAAGPPLLDALEQHGAAPASTSGTTSVRSASPPFSRHARWPQVRILVFCLDERC